MIVTSPANPRIKAVAGLRRRRARDAERRTVVEGHEELSLALEAGVVPELLLVCPELMAGGVLEDVLARAGALLLATGAPAAMMTLRPWYAGARAGEISAAIAAAQREVVDA